MEHRYRLCWKFPPVKSFTWKCLYFLLKRNEKMVWTGVELNILSLVNKGLLFIVIFNKLKKVFVWRKREESFLSVFHKDRNPKTESSELELHSGLNWEVSILAICSAHHKFSLSTYFFHITAITRFYLWTVIFKTRSEGPFLTF